MADPNQTHQQTATWDKQFSGLKSKVYDFVINQILLPPQELEHHIQNMQHSASSLVEKFRIEAEQLLDCPLFSLRLNNQDQCQLRDEAASPNDEIQSLKLRLTKLIQGIKGLTLICNEAQNVLRGEPGDWSWGLPSFFENQCQQLKSFSTRLILRLQDFSKFLVQAISRETEELIEGSLARLRDKVLDQNKEVQVVELHLAILLHKMQRLHLICNDVKNILRGEQENSAHDPLALFVSQNQLLTNISSRLIPNLKNTVDLLIKAIRLQTEELLNGTLARLQVSQDESQLEYGASNRNAWMKNLEDRLTQLVLKIQGLKHFCNKMHNLLGGEEEDGWVRDLQNFFRYHSQLLEEFTTRLILKSLILESQPDWIIRKGRIISPTLRLLPPFCLELGHNLTVDFKVHTLNKVDASDLIQRTDPLLGTDTLPPLELHSESVTVPNKCIIKLGKGSNNKVKVSSVHRVKTEKGLPAKRRRMATSVENDEVEESEKKDDKGESAKKEKFCLLFSFDCLIQEKNYKIWCCSRPFVFVTNRFSQGIVGEAKMFWSMNFPLATKDNAFGDQKTVPWSNVASALKSYFTWKTDTTRDLSVLNLEHLKENLLGPTSEPAELNVTQTQLLTTRTGSAMSFWDWFHCIIDFINGNEQVKNLWNAGLLIGFISNDDVNLALQNEESGTFLIRFSDSSRRGTTMVYLGDEGILHCCFEQDELKFAHKSLVERILTEWGIRKLYYENADGLTIGDKHEKLKKFKPTDENDGMLPYIVTQAGKRYVVHRGNLPGLESKLAKQKNDQPILTENSLDETER